MPSINSCLYVLNIFNLPENLIGRLISYYLGSDKKIMMAKYDINPNANTTIRLVYKPLSISEFSKELASL